jgi:hypothetical protein
MAIFRHVDSLTCALALGSVLLGAGCGGSSNSATQGSSGAGNTSSSSGGGGDSSSSDNAGDSSTTTTPGGGADNSDNTPTGCPKSALTILFSPMYSAYDGTHTFQVPAVVNGLDPTQIMITWSASDPSMVKLESDPTTGGVMITTQKAGKVSIIATAGSLCGSSLLTITSADASSWTNGSMRYNDGVVINRLPRPGGGGRPGGTGGTGAGGTSASGGAGGSTAADAACTNCHGDTAMGPYKTVQHTPEQTGGFSDADLINIFQKGIVPTGGYFDATIVSYATWQTFHKWDVGDTPQDIVIYLRSLTPAAQTGMANFGGQFMRGGGGAGGGRGFGRGGAGGAATTGGTSAGGAATGGGGTGGDVSGGTGGA